MTRAVINSAPDDVGTLSDEQVVTLVLDGHTALFEVLMRRHNQRLYRAARAIVKDESEAEDVMQQAYVNAFSHLAQFDRRAQFLTWLTRIAIHEALARARRNGRCISLASADALPLDPAAPIDAAPSPERLAFSSELGALMESAIDQLSDGAREVFVLRQVEGMSTDEVAAVLDISVDVVKTRLSRARAALREELWPHAEGTVTNAFRFLRPRCDLVVAAVFARIR